MRYKLQHFIDYKNCETENRKTTKKTQDKRNCDDMRWNVKNFANHTI